MPLRHTRIQEELSKFNSHSLRIGAATTAAKHGLKDSFIQTGRWKSAAYKLYKKNPPLPTDRSVMDISKAE